MADENRSWMRALEPHYADTNGSWREATTETSALAHAILDRKADAIATAARRYGVRRLEVVGSAARGEDFDPRRSDVDFLVMFETDAGMGPLEQFFGLRDALAELLGRPVDLIEVGAVSSPYLKEAFDAAREVVFAA